MLLSDISYLMIEQINIPTFLFNAFRLTNGQTIKRQKDNYSNVRYIDTFVASDRIFRVWRINVRSTDWRRIRLSMNLHFRWLPCVWWMGKSLKIKDRKINASVFLLFRILWMNKAFVYHEVNESTFSLNISCLTNKLKIEKGMDSLIHRRFYLFSTWRGKNLKNQKICGIV